MPTPTIAPALAPALPPLTCLVCGAPGACVDSASLLVRCCTCTVEYPLADVLDAWERTLAWRLIAPKVFGASAD